MGPSALQKMVAGERLLRNILPDVVSEAENVPGMGKHLVYPGGCSCFPSQEHSWRYSSGETWWIHWQMHQMPSAPDASNAGPWQWGSHEPLTSLAAEPGKQGQELPVFRELPQEQRFTRCLTRRRSVSAAPVCSWRAVGRRRPFVCLLSRPPRFSLALGIGCQGMQGIAPAQGQNIFLK